jgi:hypothetical protein
MTENFTKQIIPIFLFQSSAHLPNWLLRVPESKLSFAAKILYGFMAEISDSSGTFRINEINFMDTLGMSDETLIKSLKELINEKLIISHSKNEYQFYSHKWMEGQYEVEN